MVPLINALHEYALGERQRIERRLREIPDEIARAQAELEGLLGEKIQLQQQKRRTEALIAFGSAPRLLREDRFCPHCYIDHGTKVRLASVAASTPLGQYRCEVCSAEFNLEGERSMES